MALFIYLIVITNPYEGRGIDYGQDEPQLYEYRNNLGISVVEPEPDNNQTSFTEEETLRFINKVNKIINYSPYVYEKGQVIDD